MSTRLPAALTVLTLCLACGIGLCQATNDPEPKPISPPQPAVTDSEPATGGGRPALVAVPPGQLRMFRNKMEYLNQKAQDSEALLPQYWARLDFSSPGAYDRSLAPYRLDVMEAFGVPKDLRQPQLITAISSRIVKTIGGVDIYRWVLQIGSGGLQQEALVGIPQKRKSPMPVVMGFYGNGGSPESAFGLTDRPDYHNRFALKLAAQGYVVFVPYTVVRRDDMQVLDLNGLNLEARLAGLEVGTAMRSLDYILSLNFVKPKSIAVFGIGYGGSLAFLLGALDTRVNVTIVSGAFGDVSIAHKEFPVHAQSPCYQQIWGSVSKFGNGIFGMIAPRMFYVEHGKRDNAERLAVEGTFRKYVEPAYEKLAIPDACGYQIVDGGRSVFLKESLMFLKYWVSPSLPVKASEGDRPDQDQK